MLGGSENSVRVSRTLWGCTGVHGSKVCGALSQINTKKTQPPYKKYLEKSHEVPQFNNYTTLRQDRSHKTGGGLITKVKDNLTYPPEHMQSAYRKSSCK